MLKPSTIKATIPVIYLKEGRRRYFYLLLAGV